MVKTFSLAACCVLLSTAAFAQVQDCNSYEYGQNMSVDNGPAGLKIIATAAVGVDFDDIDSINDARELATLEAKSMIAKFMSESIKSEVAIKQAVNTTKTMQGEQKSVQRDEATQKLKSLASSSAALLRGVVPLGSCYTKGKEFRVSVGIKPETIASAENISRQISNSVNNSPAPTPQVRSPQDAQAAPAQRGTVTTPLNGMNGFNDSRGLSKF